MFVQISRLDGPSDSVWTEDVVIVERMWAPSEFIVQTLQTLRSLQDLGMAAESVRLTVPLLARLTVPDTVRSS